MTFLTNDKSQLRCILIGIIRTSFIVLKLHLLYSPKKGDATIAKINKKFKLM